jgi:hypothetical protein
MSDLQGRYPGPKLSDPQCPVASEKTPSSRMAKDDGRSLWQSSLIEKR